MTAYTPGPWTVTAPQLTQLDIEADSNSIIVYGPNGGLHGIGGETHEIATANAHLIAAAPDLLGALGEIEVLVADILYDVTPDWDKIVIIQQTAVAAIVKATGDKS